MLSANVSWSGSRARGRVAVLAILTLADLGTEGDVLLRSADGGFLGGHGDGIGRLLGWWSRDRWSRRRKEEVEGSRNAARCGPAELESAVPTTRQESFLCPPDPAAGGVRAPPLFLRDFIQSCANFHLFSPIRSSHSSIHRNTAHRNSLLLHFRDSWLSLVCAERDAQNLQSWAKRLWASSEWAIWARCTPEGSPTLAGGRCKVSCESACTVSISQMVRCTPNNSPSLHPDDLSAFGSSMAVWHLPCHLGVVDWAAVDDVKSQLP